MKSTWSFYDASTGAFIDRTFTGSEKALHNNTPAGCAAWPGRVDCLSKRVVDGKLEEFRPSAPSDLHEWNEAALRWIIRADVQQRREARAIADSELSQLDSKRIRVLSELALDPDKAGEDGKTPRERLEALESQAETARQVRKENPDRLPERKPAGTDAERVDTPVL
jgi:hypothetical protein